MTTTTERPTPAPTFDPSKPAVDVLPERGGERLTLTWRAVTTDDTPQAGFATITGRKRECVYVLTEFPTGWAGRGFYFAKFASKSGTDQTREGYTVYAFKAGSECECKGYMRHRHCCHADALDSLIRNQWI